MRDEQLFPSRQLLCPLAEHIFSRLLIKRLLDELADRKARLHLRPGANLRVPALDVRIIVKRETLRLMRHGPGKAGDVGDRIIAGDVSAGLAELGIQHTIKPRRLVAVALDRIGDFLRRIERKMAVLAEHRTQSPICLFFFKQKTAYELGLGIPAEPLFRSLARLVLRLT